jgi:hypothetical protein
MKLFKVENFKLQISEEALVIKVFSDLWKRDRSKSKEKVLQEFGIIYFMYDPRSPYMYLTETDERWQQILKHEGLPSTYKFDNLLIEASEVYISLIQTTSTNLLQAAKEASEKVRVFLTELNLYEEDDKGKPKYPLNMIVNAIKQIPDLTKQIHLAEIAVSSEIEENNRIRGQKQKSLLDDGFDNFTDIEEDD